MSLASLLALWHRSELPQQFAANNRPLCRVCGTDLHCPNNVLQATGRKQLSDSRVPWHILA